MSEFSIKAASTLKMLADALIFISKIKRNHLALNAPPEDLSLAMIKLYEQEDFIHKDLYMVKN
ncbi:hypothetical protein [Kiloniella sp. EL199]|uniref:hypothetical protein n=1 Tax=Kiloniella sp. EL199 TaxID=2107581 RepID=UPI000EA37AC5|nr:hypothetical protein [Kiloniella sp. EL199]